MQFLQPPVTSCRVGPDIPQAPVLKHRQFVSVSVFITEILYWAQSKLRQCYAFMFSVERFQIKTYMSDLKGRYVYK